MRGDMIETWKILNGKEDVSPATWFRMASEGGQTTRLGSHPLNLYKPQYAKSEIRTNFFSQRVTDKWNSLPDNLKEAGTIETFKNGYDKLMNEL